MITSEQALRHGQARSELSLESAAQTLAILDGCKICPGGGQKSRSPLPDAEVGDNPHGYIALPPEARNR